jgi:hypothetical protein
MRRPVLAALAAAVALVALAASSALAAAPARSGSVNFVPQRFGVQAGKLVATGTISVNSLIGTGSPAAPTSVTIPVIGAKAIGAAGTCQGLELALGPIDVGLTHVERVLVDLQAAMPGNLLCAFADVVNGTSPSAFVEAVLNRLLSSVDHAVASGTGPNGALFAGSFTPQQAVLAASGTAAVRGDLAGRLTQPARTPQGVNRTVMLPLVVTGACGSIRLQTAATTVTLHDVPIQLRPIMLSPTPVMGAGGADLLCGISQMLDGHSLEGTAYLLNTMLK